MTSQIGRNGVQTACRIVGKQVVKLRLGVDVMVAVNPPPARNQIPDRRQFLPKWHVEIAVAQQNHGGGPVLLNGR